ncbi:MAG TPA: hypothetical protein PKM67_07520 [Kiritimatiellia bacterium]|nr:hypothetical protein [Kiritimatiellia bacterium]HNR94256.1 hypothetical protein [Kiritimatiellia bacterium]HNS81290.1 hypothetical protein [Kiritimatiellia bacterium]
MKTRISKYTILAALFLGGIAFFVTGCDSEDSPDNGGLDNYFKNNPYVSDPRIERDSYLTVTPSLANVGEVGQQVLFRVSGGSGGYTWDVSYPGRGTIQGEPASSDAIYTVRSVADNEVIVYDSVGHAGIAFISAAAASSSALAMTASSTQLNVDGAKCVLTAVGGVPPYAWAVDDVARGNVSANAGNSVIYTRFNAGDNAVSLTDSAGTVLYIVIQQP